MLTVSLAVLTLALVAIGLRAATRSDPRDEAAIEVPPRVTAPSRGSTTTAPPSSSPRSSSPSTTTPGSPGTTQPPLDVTSPRLKLADPDGRFEVTFPRGWVNVPTSEPEQTQWVPFAEQAGNFTPTEFLFAVRWAPSNGCDLQRCTEEVVRRLQANSPGINPTTANDAIGGEPAMRIEATTPTQRLVAWVVVKGDRYWVPQLRGPSTGFDEFLVAGKQVVATMTFG